MSSFSAPPRPKVLVVDDEPVICQAVADALPTVSDKVALALSSMQAIQKLNSDHFDVVLCDFYMPGGGGLDVLQQASRMQQDTGFILMTGRPQVEDLIAACRLHAADVLLKPFSVDSLRSSVQKTYGRVIRARAARLRRSELRNGLRHRLLELEDTRKQLRDSYRQIIESMVVILDHREHETCAHSFRVRSYALHLADLVNYPGEQLGALSTAALLHDIGKVAVPDQILLKPGALDAAEVSLLQQHSSIGEQIVRRSVALQKCAPIIRHHHERWDGNGYPDRLSRETIPLGSRLFALADTLDAMTSDRCYRAALPLQSVHEEVERCAGKQFDPELARVFQSVPDSRWMELRNEADAQAATFNPLALGATS